MTILAAWERWKMDNRSRIAAYSRVALLGATVVRMLSFLLLFGGLGLWFMWQARDGDYWVRHTFRVITALRSLDKSMTESERVQRNYLITGRRSARESYVEQRAETWKWYREVRRLTVDNPYQQARLVELDGVMTDKFGFLDEAVAERRDRGFEAAEAIIDSGRGEVIIGRFNRLIAALDDEEYALLDVRQRWQQWCSAMLWVVLLAATARDLYIFWLLISELIRRRHDEPSAGTGEHGTTQPRGSR